MTPTEFLILAENIGMLLVIAGIALGFVRLALGPTLADRVVALDMMSVTIVAFCALFAVRMDEPAFLDVAVVLALIGFLTTAALARFAERRMQRSPDQPLPPRPEQLRAAAERESDSAVPPAEDN